MGVSSRIGSLSGLPANRAWTRMRNRTRIRTRVDSPLLTQSAYRFKSGVRWNTKMQTFLKHPKRFKTFQQYAATLIEAIGIAWGLLSWTYFIGESPSAAQKKKPCNIFQAAGNESGQMRLDLFTFLNFACIRNGNERRSR
jgi:hypothetical protein